MMWAWKIKLPRHLNICALDEILKMPGAALQLIDKVNKVYAPELEIEVKN